MAKHIFSYSERLLVKGWRSAALAGARLNSKDNNLDTLKPMVLPKNWEQLLLDCPLEAVITIEASASYEELTGFSASMPQMQSAFTVTRESIDFNDSADRVVSFTGISEPLSKATESVRGLTGVTVSTERFSLYFKNQRVLRASAIQSFHWHRILGKIGLTFKCTLGIDDFQKACTLLDKNVTSVHDIDGAAGELKEMVPSVWGLNVMVASTSESGGENLQQQLLEVRWFE